MFHSFLLTICFAFYSFPSSCCSNDLSLPSIDPIERKNLVILYLKMPIVPLLLNSNLSGLRKLTYFIFISEF